MFDKNDNFGNFKKLKSILSIEILPI